MTVDLDRHRVDPHAQTLLVAVAVAVAAGAGCVALASRGISWRAVAITLAVGLAAVLTPARRERRTTAAAWIGAVAIGVAALMTVRVFSVSLPLTASPLTAVASLAGAAAEELFFRRLLYDALVRRGVAVAVVGAALAFAFVHVPTYSFAVVPIDLTAGLVLGWQRWAANTWTAPAATHLVANIISLV